MSAESASDVLAASPMRRWVRSLVLLLLSLACAWIIVGLVGRVDWREVGDALGKLALWQGPVLLAVLVVRQVLNAAPLAVFIDGLGIGRAVQNDQSAILMSTIAPPPADLVMRLSMFASWQISATRGLAGAMMNTVTFYVIRFAAPTVGVLLIGASSVPYHAIYGWSAVLGGAVALTILGLLWAALRRETAALWIGRTAGQACRRFRRSVEPEKWAASAADFRSHVVRRSPRGVPLSLTSLLVMVVVDGFLLTLSLRFVGVPASALSAAAIVGVFLVVYPLTLFPLAGLGVVDAMVLAALVETGGLALEPEIVGGLVVYRVTTLLVPVVFGLASVAWWRHTEGAA